MAADALRLGATLKQVISEKGNGMTRTIFFWVVGICAGLLIVAFALPSEVWASLGSLPAHPLIVHAIIVLIPLLSVLIVVGLFVRKLLSAIHVYAAAGLGLVSVAAVGAKSSGEALGAVGREAQVHHGAAQRDLHHKGAKGSGARIERDSIRAARGRG